MKAPAVVLAGGRATRMGGGDKCLIEIAGRPVLSHVLERLRPQAGAIALNANGDAARFAAWDLPVFADSIGEWPGPLAGVLAAMEWAAEAGADHVLTVAGDTPFFPTDLASRLATGRRDASIALAATPDPERGLARHPTFGLWPTDLADDLREALSDGVRKVVAWANPHGVALVPFADKPFDPFFNVNTPDDKARAEAIAREHGL